ncbi:MAG: hypothetical protein F6K09_13155 [Merismopedia sp. SIO2A8]|nr:hypothetical protein [Merismopedia sp. SIO2A8]
MVCLGFARITPKFTPKTQRRKGNSGGGEGRSHWVDELDGNEPEGDRNKLGMPSLSNFLDKSFKIFMKS